MLPASFASAQSRGPAAPLPGWVRGVLSAALALVLLLPLQACNALAQPSQKVLLAALALQIELTQQQVAEALALPGSGEGLPQVSRLRVEHQEAIAIGEAKGLRLEGRFDWRLAGDPIRVDSPFDLVLQRGERGESWRLARPGGSSDGLSQRWLTYPLPVG